MNASTLVEELWIDDRRCGKSRSSRGRCWRSSHWRWQRRLLRDSTGRDIDVRPVVVFPGWFVEAAAGAQRKVWVMEPKGLPAFLAQEPPRHAAEDVRLAAYHLSRYVRAESAR